MRERDLESTRFGRGVQITGLIFMLWAIANTIIDAIFNPVIIPVNAITLGCGMWCSLVLGPRAIRQAREHKEYMDAHRARVRYLNSRWN